MTRRDAPSTVAGWPGRRLPGLLLAGLLLANVSVPAPAAAQVEGDDSFRYQEPQRAYPLRAAGLVGIYLGAQILSYTLTPRPPDPMYELVYTPWDKLVHGAISYDSNTFRTNFVGHPTMGSILYLMARGSRLPSWQASLWAVAGSTTWEFIEYHEKASINDLIVTPLVGIAVGEPFFQLGAHLDRSPESTSGTVLSWIVSPFKKLNDLYDGARPARGDPGDHLVVWASAGGGATEGSDWRSGEGRLGGGWRLVRSVDYGAPGHDLHGWLDGQVTAVAFTAAFRGGGLCDGRFESGVLLASLYARDLDAQRRGTDLIAGLGAGFELRTHQWTPSGASDYAGLVYLPRAVAEGRWLAGGFRLGARLEGSALFAGTRSFALDGDPAAVPEDELPTGQLQYGYHFGFGAGLHPALQVELGPAAIAAAWRAEALWPANQPDPVDGRKPTARLEERWAEGRVRAAWRFSSGVELAADATWRQRWSRADASTRSASDRSLGLTLGWVSDP